jgi:hypothetical protein
MPGRTRKLGHTVEKHRLVDYFLDVVAIADASSTRLLSSPEGAKSLSLVPWDYPAAYPILRV